MDTRGVTDVTINAGDRSCQCTCFVVPAGETVLFGRDVISQLHLLSKNEQPFSKTDVNVVRIEPIDITVDPQVPPASLPARRHAFTLHAAIEAELQRLKEADVIESVREATPWVSPLVPVRKSNGALRLCVDYRQLNKAIVRERHMLPTLEEITSKLAGAKMFSVLDAESGFHQIPLSERSRKYTTFITPCGLYRFKRLPFGIACAPEIFQRVVEDILRGLDGVLVYVDDILVFGKDREEHDARMKSALERLSAANLTINWAKCQIRQTRVKYLGHWLTDQGISPDADKMRAIQDMPCPQSVADVRRFLGMITYLGKFIPTLAQATKSLRELAKRDPFVCDGALEQAFKEAKRVVGAALQKLAYFQPSPLVPTAISSDASPKGLGAMLWQQDRRGEWIPVAGASRSLTDTETRYSQMEREMLGVVFAITRFRQYVLGRQVQVFTDHKPLISIIHKPFDEVPPRLQRWLVALMPYQFSLTYKPGQNLVCADTLSRAPLPEQICMPEECRGIGEYVSMVLEEAPVKVSDIQLATKEDPVLSSVMHRVLTNAWKGYSPSEELYYLVRDQLTVVDDILLLANRYVIPEALRRSILRLGHEGHPGLEAFRDTLRTRVWWPGLTKDVTIFAERCDVCWRRRLNPPQQLQPSDPEIVWNKLAVDLVTIEGKTCVSVIDYGSRFPEIIPLEDTTAAGVINKLMEVFARYGLPAVMVSDNGPQFSAKEMNNFLKQLGIQHVRASPRYPQSNGMVERLHRTVKERLKGLRPSIPFYRRLQQTLMDIRNSVNRMLGTTPSEALFQRILQTRVPAYGTARVVNPEHQSQAKAEMANNHDSRRGVCSLPKLKSGTVVVLQDGYTHPSKQWKVLEQYGQQVSVTDGQRIMLRNRRHVRPWQPYTPITLPEASDVKAAGQNEVPSNAPRTDPSAPSVPTAPVSTADVTRQSSQDSTKTAPVQTSLTNANQNSSMESNTASTPQSFYKEGVVTRSGRLVRLSERARGADI